MRMIDGLSLEPPMAEQRFLESELGVRWQQIDPAELEQALRSGYPRALIVSDPDLYAHILRSVPARSVVLVQISDENYSAARRAMADSPAIRTLFRHYAPQVAAARDIARAVAGFAADASRSAVSLRSLLPLYRSGAQVRERMKSWSSVSYLPVPLGYTSAFQEAHERLESHESDRSISVVFRGNRGMATRIVGTDAAMKVTDSRITFVDDHAWSGIGGGALDYVEELMNARFALVPPGFVNGETFRYYEAVRCGALPIEIDVALTHQGVVPFRSPASIRTHNWHRALAMASTMPEVERVARVSAAQRAIDDAFTQSRTQLLQSMEG